MALDVTSLLGVLPVTAREITRDETSISWRKVKLRLSVSRSNAPSPESVHEDLPDYEDAPEASSHANDRGGAEDEDESEEEDELEDDNEVASDTAYSNPLPDSPPRHPSVLGLDFTSPIDLTQDDQQAHVLSQLAGIDLRDSTDGDGSSETRLREAEAFIASAVLHSQSLTSTSSPPTPPDEPLHEHHDTQSTDVSMAVRRVGRYETIYGLHDSDDEGYFEVSRPGIARWSSTEPTKTCRKTPTHRELSLHPRLPSFLSVIPRYHRTYGSTWFKQNSRVKRVLDARKRRHASNPEVVPSPGFVQKAVERFGPSWRPRLPSVFDRVLKKTASDSAVILDVHVSNSEQLRAGNDIARPAHVPRMDDPQSDAYTGSSILPSDSNTTLSARGNAPLRIQSDTTMTVQADEEVPECIVVPSTPPPSLPSLVAPQPQPPLPYLASQTNSGRAGGADYPYVATPPLDSRNADSVTVSSGSWPVPLPYLVPLADSGGGGRVECAYIPTPPLDSISLPTPRLTREASLPTPRLTREASFASENSSFVPTPESGRLALPGLPVDGLGVPSIEENLGTKSLKSGWPAGDDGVSYSLDLPPQPIVPIDVRAPVPRAPLPYFTSTAGSRTNNDAPYIATPPLPSMPLAPALIVPPSLPLSSSPFTPPHPPAPTTDIPTIPITTHPQSIIPPTPTLTLPTLPLPTTAQPPPLPPLTTVLPSFPVGQLPPPLPPLMPITPPLVPSLSVGVPLAVEECMRSSQSQPPSASASGSLSFDPSPMLRITQPVLLQSSSLGSGSSLAPTHSLVSAGPTHSSNATVPALQLQIPLLAAGRIAGPELESMDCEEDAYAPLIKMTSPTEQLPKPDFVMGEERGLYAAARPEVPVGQANVGSLDGEAQHVVSDVRNDGPSYQGASGSVYASGKDGKGKHRATDEDGLDGDHPPFDETDPLWQELLAYKADPHGDGSSFCVDAAGQGEVVASTGEHVELAEYTSAQSSFDSDLNTSWTSDELSWDFSDVLNSADSNSPDQPESEGDVWKELCAWADEQPPELLESVFGMLDTSAAEAPSVESVGFGYFSLLEESSSLQSAVPTITVEPPTPPLPSPTEYYPHPQFAQNITDFDEQRRIYPSVLEASTSFTLDELDWDVMEEYAQLEDLECPDNSVDAARVMVVAIRAVSAKAKTGFSGMSEDRVFLPPAVINFPAGHCGIAGGQGVSPEYEYVSLLDNVQVPMVPWHHQAHLPSTSLALAAS